MLQELHTKPLQKDNQSIALERYIAALDVSCNGIAIVNKKEYLEYINHSLLQILSIETGCLTKYLGQDWRNLFKGRIMPESLDKIERALKFEDEQPYSLSILYEIEGKEHKTLSLYVKTLEDQSAILSIQDMTANQQAEMEKTELQDQFYQSQKMEAIGRLAGGISHDFNNILAAINGYAEFLIQDLAEGSPTQKFAQNILEAGLRARTLVDQMLAFSRRQDNLRDTVDLTSALKNTVSMLQASLPKTIKVEQNIHVNTAKIRGNIGQVTQILMNICVNAGDAMEEDHGILNLTIQREEFENFINPELFTDKLPSSKESAPIVFMEPSPDRTILSLGTVVKEMDYYCLSVQDTGCGMSRVIMEHIFEPFFTTKPVDKGTGLGLSMVHGAITSHQGCIVIDSTLCKGTTFNLYFPADVSDLEESPSPLQSDLKEETQNITIEDSLILLVEDQDDVREMTLNMLTRMGIEAESAKNGLEALRILRENPDVFDLVIADYNMPSMTGLELIQYVGAELPNIPFIFLSGYSQEKVTALIKGQKNVIGVLRKPIKKEDLYRYVTEAISKVRALK